jgi:hypothetical protein
VSINGFGNGQTFVKLDEALGLGTSEIEINPGQASLRDGGLAVLTTDGNGVQTQWWVPTERVLYLRQVQPAPQEQPEQPPAAPSDPEPEDPEAPPAG